MDALPKTMSAVILEELGDVSKLQYRTDIAIPTPAEGEVLVRNEFTGINFIDTHLRAGRYKAPGYPAILGGEAAGTVVAAHASVASLFKPGDRVVYMSEAGGGTRSTPPCRCQASLRCPPTSRRPWRPRPLARA